MDEKTRDMMHLFAELIHDLYLGKLPHWVWHHSAPWQKFMRSDDGGAPLYRLQSKQ